LLETSNKKEKQIRNGLVVAAPGISHALPEFPISPLSLCERRVCLAGGVNSSLTGMQTQGMQKFDFFLIFFFLHPLFYKVRILESELFFSSFATP
jgi:hypothetical protein